MRIGLEAGKNNPYHITPENLDDLWELSHILEEGDEIRAKTERKVTVGSDKQIRKPMVLTGLIKHIELQGDILRIQTTLTSGPDDFISIGDHHSFTIQKHTTITLLNALDTLREEALKKTQEHIPQQILLVTFDREEAWIAQLTKQGYNVLATLKGEVQKKAPGGGSENFYKTIAKEIQEQEKRIEPISIILASPAFWNEYVYKELPDTIKKKIIQANCNAVGEAALREVLKREETTQALKADQSAKETRLIEKILIAIAQDKACYGYSECKEKIELGQVQLLILSDDHITLHKKEGTYTELDTLLIQAKQMQSEIHIIQHEKQQLNALGGIAGILRW